MSSIFDSTRLEINNFIMLILCIKLKFVPQIMDKVLKLHSKKRTKAKTDLKFLSRLNNIL